MSSPVLAFATSATYCHQSEGDTTNSVTMNAAIATLLERAHEVLLANNGIAFAYVHGSALESASPCDIDIAVYLDHEWLERCDRASGPLMEFVIPLELALESALGMPVDVQILNRAPLPFRARVVTQGRPLIDKAPAVRADFEYRSRYEYFDFLPRRREYLAEILA